MSIRILKFRWSVPLAMVIGGLSLVVGVYAVTSWQSVDFNKDNKVNSMDLLSVIRYWGCPDNCLIKDTISPTKSLTDGNKTSNCEQSKLGANLMNLKEFNEDNGPEMVQIASEGYGGLVAALTCEMTGKYFPQFDSKLWKKTTVCNKLDCLRERVDPQPPSPCTGVEYEYVGYGPERKSGVPVTEWNNLSDSVKEAEKIVKSAGKKLVLSFSTKQIHLEAVERDKYGKDWNNINTVIADLAPSADVWIIQAADEYNNPNENKYGPILSQRHFTPDDPRWRQKTEEFVIALKKANPNIEIWIQLALHRIPTAENPPGGNGQYPDAGLLLRYRDKISDLVDGVLVSSFYSWAVCNTDKCNASCPNNCEPPGHIVADQELQETFRCACGGNCKGIIPQPSSPNPTPTLIQSTPTIIPTSGSSSIRLVEEGWTKNKSIAEMTLVSDMYYRVYESNYPCGGDGNYQFMVVDSNQDMKTAKNVFVKFLGGGMGFWYQNTNNAIANGESKEYFSHRNALGLLNQKLNYNWFFRTGLSQEYANGVTKKFRENNDFRMLILSYCSHDLYYGKGQYSQDDGFYRYGYTASMDAIDFIQKNYATKKLITYGGSAGASGSFNVGKDQDNVAGIIMDSMSTDLTAISDQCKQGVNVFGNQQGNSNHPCCCPELEADGQPPYQVENGWCAPPYSTPCAQIFANRINFKMGTDEPYILVNQNKISTPIFYIWNYHDAGDNAHYLYNNLQKSIRTKNPGGSSVACRVCLPNNDPSLVDPCIADDSYQPQGPCNVHVPSGDDEFPSLVNKVYNWGLERVK